MPDCERPMPSPYSGPRMGPAADVQKMIKTFSLSALFFMTLGVLAATHAGLPF